MYCHFKHTKDTRVDSRFSLLAFASLASADSIGVYGDTQTVTGPDGNPAWQLTSDASGPNIYSGVYDTITGPLTSSTLTQLSADYVMLTGTFDGGAPRFSLTDGSGNEAWIYFGTPAGGGTFTDPNSGNTSYANTGNYADLASPDVRVYSDDFGGDNNPNFGQTWAQFVALTGGTQIDYISVDLDGGWAAAGNQVMDLTDFDVNGTVYAPSAVPEPASAGLTVRGVPDLCRGGVAFPALDLYKSLSSRDGQEQNTPFISPTPSI